MADHSFRLDGKVAVVTGAGQGIGKALAYGLAQAGATIAVLDMPDKQVAAAALEHAIIEEGGNSRSYALDVRDIPNIQVVIDQIASDMGGVDIMINNAGVRDQRVSLEVTEADWDQVMDVNLKGLFFCAQASARYMLNQGSGRIINIASQLGITALPERAAYCASKGGVVNLTRALALEWCNNGITVNAVGPGPTNTPMVGSTLTPEAEMEFRYRSPIGRRLEAVDMVGAVVFLASPSAAAINGHLLLVDGGWTAW